MPVLVSSGCITKYHNLGGLHNISFLTFLEAGSLRSRCQQAVSSEATVFGLQVAALLLCPHMASPLCTSIPGVSLCVSKFPLVKTPGRLAWDPPQQSLFNSVISLKALSLNVVTF